MMDIELKKQENGEYSMQEKRMPTCEDRAMDAIGYALNTAPKGGVASPAAAKR